MISCLISVCAAFLVWPDAIPSARTRTAKRISHLFTGHLRGARVSIPSVLAVVVEGWSDGKLIRYVQRLDSVRLRIEQLVMSFRLRVRRILNSFEKQ